MSGIGHSYTTVHGRARTSSLMGPRPTSTLLEWVCARVGGQNCRPLTARWVGAGAGLPIPVSDEPPMVLRWLPKP